MHSRGTRVSQVLQAALDQLYISIECSLDAIRRRCEKTAGFRAAAFPAATGIRVFQTRSKNIEGNIGRMPSAD